MPFHINEMWRKYDLLQEKRKSNFDVFLLVLVNNHPKTDGSIIIGIGVNITSQHHPFPHHQFRFHTTPTNETW